MIPTKNTPRYKYILRLRNDIWKSLGKKSILKKKWRPFLERLTKQRILESRLRRKRPRQILHPRMINYETNALSKFPIYCRYSNQKNLIARQSLKLFYGALQDSNIKAIARKHSKGSWKGFGQKLEQKLSVFLFRCKITSTIGESRHHYFKKRLLLNGAAGYQYIKKGDILHFSPSFEEVVKRRIKKRQKFSFPLWLDIDLESMHFFVLSEAKHFRHPFLLQWKRLWRWYTL